MISFLSWNCRGAGHKNFVSALKHYVQGYNPKMVAVLEPRISGERGNKIRRKLGFNFSFIEEAQGFKGGIWLLWSDPLLKVPIISSTNQFIHAKVKLIEVFSGVVTFIYAFPTFPLPPQPMGGTSRTSQPLINPRGFSLAILTPWSIRQRSWEAPASTTSRQGSSENAFLTAAFFIQHRWLDSRERLADQTIQPINSKESGRTVAEAATANTRNEDIFEGKSVTSAQLRLRVHSWIAGVRETMKSSSQILFEVVGRRRDTLIRWIPAPDEWITINTDGSVTQPLSYAAGSGVIRNSQGAKLATFAANFGRCSIMRAELRIAALGLSLAWDMGFRQVNIQLDSLAAIAAIKNTPDSDGQHGLIIHQIHF
ncbi:Putative ribonuclease H protein At1g65750 [Linum perenne]